MNPGNAVDALSDPTEIANLFSRGIEDFAEGRLEIGDVAIRRLKRRSDGSCLIQCDVDVRHPEDGRRELQVWVGEAGRDGVLRGRQQAADAEPLHRPLLGEALHRLRDPDVLLFVFPNDPVLTGLPTLWDRERLLAYLASRREAFRLPAGVGIASVETRTVKYVGTERCTFRHSIALDDGSSRIVFSKVTGSPAEIRASFDAMRGFHAALGSGSVAVPEPFLLDPALNAVFIPGLDGVNADLRLDELDLEKVGSDVGAALAALHGCEIEGLPELRDDELLRRLPRAQAVLGEFGDPHRARVDRVSARLAERLPGLPHPPARPLHGTFRLSQLLVGADGADGLALVDFDSCVRGDPIFDVGSFVAYLVYLGHKGKLAEERSALCIRSFCRAYAERAPWGLPPDLLRWYVAAQLVTKHARRSGVRRPKKGDRDARQKKALELAARLLDAADAILLGELEPI